MKRFTYQEAPAYQAEMQRRKVAYHYRLGQAILNDNPDLCPCPEVYYCEDEQRVLAWFYANLVGEGEVTLPTDLSMVVNEALRAERREARVSLVGITKANRFGAIK